MFWNEPVLLGGCASLPDNGLPPSTSVSLHTYFFIPWDGGTHGPPVSLHPGEPAIAISMPNWSPRWMAYLNASFHSGVIYARRLSTTCGVCRAASKFWKPATPTRCIHSRSSLMPSCVMFPFIQCHQTRGRADLGGFLKSCCKRSSCPSEHALSNSRIATTRTSDRDFILVPPRVSGRRSDRLQGLISRQKELLITRMQIEN